MASPASSFTETASPARGKTESTVGTKRKLQTVDSDGNDEVTPKTVGDKRPKKRVKPASEAVQSSLNPNGTTIPISLKDRYKGDVAMDDASDKSNGSFIQQINASKRKVAGSKSNKKDVPDTQAIPRPSASGEVEEPSARDECDSPMNDAQEEDEEDKPAPQKARKAAASRPKTDATGASKRKLDSSRTTLALPGEPGGPKAISVWRQKWYGTGCEQALKDRSVWDDYVVNWKRLGIKVTTQVKAEALYWHDINALKEELQDEIEARGPEFQFREGKTLAECLAGLPVQEEQEEQDVAPPTTSKPVKKTTARPKAKTPHPDEREEDGPVVAPSTSFEKPVNEKVTPARAESKAQKGTGLPRDASSGKAEKKLWKSKPVHKWVSLSEEELRKAARKRRVDLTPHPQEQWAYLLAKHDLLEEDKPVENLQGEFDQVKQAKQEALSADDRDQASPNLSIQSDHVEVETVSPDVIAERMQPNVPVEKEVDVPSTRPVPSKRPELKKSPSKVKRKSSSGVTKNTSSRKAEKNIRRINAERLMEAVEQENEDDCITQALEQALSGPEEEQNPKKALAEAERQLKEREEAEGKKEWMEEVQKAIFDALKRDLEAGKPVEPVEKLGDGGGSEEKLVRLFAGKSIQWFISSHYASRGIQLSYNCPFDPDDGDDPGFWSEEE
ncbi:hypothetical protein BU16DRAFT_534579 [Lophium mytilinum]|uniref:Uncharacterized protein n=1 Tax=Lophium mytilinum TaxID=390894 RepID=A0A6A6R574_9PEZI|nr:hypothetical protein BU16DRAFT_534579 [Lophium mytilinum]